MRMTSYVLYCLVDFDSEVVAQTNFLALIVFDGLEKLRLSFRMECIG